MSTSGCMHFDDREDITVYNIKRAHMHLQCADSLDLPHGHSRAYSAYSSSRSRRALLKLSRNRAVQRGKRSCQVGT